MDEGKLPQVHKVPEQGPQDTASTDAASGTTADLGSAFVVDESQGMWRPPTPTAAERELSDELQVVVAMRLSYRGDPFCGFAKQPGQLTVQGSVEEALSKVFRHPVETVCAGRTDSGVHARGQWVSFSLTAKEWNERSEYKILKSLNALTHEDISVREIVRKDLDFSARFSARTREYRYFICTDQPRPLLMRDFSWHLGKELDLEAMRKAASYLIGEHDFRSFCMAASAEGKTTNRNVVSIDIEPCQMWGENLVVITVIGNAFLHSMVRTIVGTLVMVGRGKRSPEWVADVLEARNRSAAGENAPAAGLVFWKVSYEGEFVYDPDAKRKAQQAEELARATAKANRKFRLFGAPLFENLEFQIPRGNPRGEGELPISGAWLSDVKSDNHEDTGGFAQIDYGALRNPTNLQLDEPSFDLQVSPASGATEPLPVAALEGEADDCESTEPRSGERIDTVAHRPSASYTPAAALTETGMFGDVEWDVDLDEAQGHESLERDDASEPEVDFASEAEEPEDCSDEAETPELCGDGFESPEPWGGAVRGDEAQAADAQAEEPQASESRDDGVIEPLEPAASSKCEEAKESTREEKAEAPKKNEDALRIPSGKHAKKKRYPFEERPLPYQLK